MAVPVLMAVFFSGSCFLPELVQLAFSLELVLYRKVDRHFHPVNRWYTFDFYSVSFPANTSPLAPINKLVASDNINVLLKTGWNCN
jgi:hypothetical protein